MGAPATVRPYAIYVPIREQRSALNNASPLRRRGDNMGPPLSSNPEVLDIISAIERRDVTYLESFYNSVKPSPTYIMYACSVLLGDPGPDHIAELIKKVPGKKRRPLFIDLAIKLAKVPDPVVETPVVEAPKQRRRRKPKEVDAGVQEVTPVQDSFHTPIVEQSTAELPNLNKRRRRKEKRGIDAGMVIPTPSYPITLSQPIPTDEVGLEKTMKEVLKTLYNIDSYVSSSLLIKNVKAEGFVLNPIEEIRKRVMLIDLKQNAIREALLAFEKEQIRSGALIAPVVSDKLSEFWPIDIIKEDKPPF